MIDIDNFKQINDAHGHDRGDQVLRELAAFLRQSVRGNDIAGRYGGDEFVVALCGDEDAPAEAREMRARAVVDRLRSRFEEAGRSGRFSAPLAVSIGHARSGPSSEDCLKLADEAMYREKRRRKRSASRSRSEEKSAAAPESATGGRHERHTPADASGEPISALRVPSIRPSPPLDRTPSSD